MRSKGRASISTSAKGKITGLIEKIFHLFMREEVHRICRKCKAQIRRRHRWHQVRVGWFSPWYTCEHWDCTDPMRDPKIPGERKSEPQLPFEQVLNVDAIRD